MFIKDDEDITDDLQDLFDGEYKENNKKSLQAIEMIFSSLINELAMYGDEVDLQALFYINKLRCIAKYMFVCMHRGHREQVVAVFRPFAELSSVINKINTFNVDEYRILRKAFVFSSRLQLINFCDEVTNANTEIDTEGLKDLYEKYYKNKYKLDSFAEFEKNMTLNSMYFLDKNKKNYKSLVMDNADIIFNEKELKEEFKTIYKISIDVSHASGYSFNACQNVIDTFAYRSQIVFWKYIFQYIYLVAITKYEHGFTANIGQVMKAIATIINGLQDELNQLIK